MIKDFYMKFDKDRIKYLNFMNRKSRFTRYSPQKSSEQSVSSKLVIKGKNIVNSERIRANLSPLEKPINSATRHSPESVYINSYLTIKKIRHIELHHKSFKHQSNSKPQDLYQKPFVSLLPSFSVKLIPKRSLTPT